MTTLQRFQPAAAPLPLRQRRRGMRYIVSAEVAFCWVDSRGITCHGKGRAQDVSTKGICVSSAASPPRGAFVAMNIVIPLTCRESQPLCISAEGRVVRSDIFGPRSCFAVQYDSVISNI